MWVCVRCGAEVESGFEVCWGCGTSVDGRVDPDFKAESEKAAEVEKAPVVLERPEYVAWSDLTLYTSEIEALAIKAHLEDADIPVNLAMENTSSTWGIPLLMPVRVQVHPEDLARARQLMSQLTAPRDLPAVLD